MMLLRDQWKLVISLLQMITLTSVKNQETERFDQRTC